ncbi:MAG: rhodanese-like domain-containing protein [Gammaproteobacteria bacterium]|nr:rhodanese-like domain-containing protein [Gammaproteobacteria bacterium]
MSEQTTTPSKSMMPWMLVALVLLLAAFANRHVVTDQDPRIAPEELMETMAGHDPPLLLDIRTPQEYLAGHIPGARLVEGRRIGQLSETLADPGRPIVLYCETGSRSRAARATLRDLGFTNLTQLEGDMRTWRRLDLPVQRGRAPGANPE